LREPKRSPLFFSPTTKGSLALIALLSILSSVAGGFYFARAQSPAAVADDPLVRMPGTQPNQGVALEAPNRCFNCHAGYNQAVEPGYNWLASMMAQAARDPIFWACLTVAAHSLSCNCFNCQLARVEGFVQRTPSDGQPSTQRTEVYFGYDDKNLYFIFICFDQQPERLRARMGRRDQISGDDFVEVDIDTFNDQRRGYAFAANPYGNQWEALYTEASGTDSSFDTLWESEGSLTPQGYVVRLAIPFKSLRFRAEPQQTWGIMFRRDIPRNNERTYWPPVSSRREGLLNQAAILTGLENISPGRNVQFIPYGTFRSFRALDTRDREQPQFVRDRSDPDAGLDAKFILKDSLVLDVALNPDFSQVESDEPQVTVNERFEVSFREKRPFFLENANFFATPINLVFTRRVADPQFGARLTGKRGRYALGAFLINDESPGKRVPEGDPREGKKALFGIVRVSRDIFGESSLGFIYTGREFEDDYNRVGGFDGRLKLSRNWVAEFQAVTSWTRRTDDRGVERMAGPAYNFAINRAGRSFNYALEYSDCSPGFRTEPGFLPRFDIRRVGQSVSYRFWPEGKFIVDWGPELSMERIYDHKGQRLDWEVNPSFSVEMPGRTVLGVYRRNLHLFVWIR
jgi:hypothetical protein